MLKVRLSRQGKKNTAFFRIVVTESTRKQTGKSKEIIGWYNPHKTKKEEKLFIKKDRLEYWKKNGAQLSDGAMKLLLTVEEKKKIWPDKQPKKDKTDTKTEVSAV